MGGIEVEAVMLPEKRRVPATFSTTLWLVLRALGARRLDISVTHVDPGPLGYLAPVMFAGFAWMVGQRLLRDWRPSRSALLYYAWVLVFMAANTVNRCQPGWCATIGFHSRGKAEW